MTTAKVMKNMRALDWSRNERSRCGEQQPRPTCVTTLRLGRRRRSPPPAYLAVVRHIR